MSINVEIELSESAGQRYYCGRSIPDFSLQLIQRVFTKV